MGGGGGNWGGNDVPAQCPARPRQITGILSLIVSKAPETEGKQHKKCFKCLCTDFFVLFHILYICIIPYTV